MPAALDRLRGVHAQLIELNMVLKQQQNIVDALNRNVAVLRQHVSRTRFNKANHPDVDRLEDQVGLFPLSFILLLPGPTDHSPLGERLRSSRGTSALRRECSTNANALSLTV